MTYANQLTILRMAFVPIFLILVAYGHPQGSLAVFVAAGLTDLLDGFIARNFGQNSALGELLDPIADKFLLVSSFIALTVQKDVFDLRIPLWLTITAISRDILLLTGGLAIRLTLGKHR
ncbi:MAG: CDP-alcohol phosphatidyltransferase family protein, partial [Acidobacteriota bacterium]